jgi:hypothetical protein
MPFFEAKGIAAKRRKRRTTTRPSALQYVNITHSRDDFPRTARHPINNINARTQGRKAAWTGQTRLKFMCQLFAPLGLGAFALNSVWLRPAALCFLCLFAAA